METSTLGIDIGEHLPIDSIHFTALMLAITHGTKLPGGAPAGGEVKALGGGGGEKLLGSADLDSQSAQVRYVLARQPS